MNTSRLTQPILAVLCLGLFLSVTTHAQETIPDNDVIRVYPEHQAPADMTIYEEALHRRAVEVAIWATPAMNYKAMYDSLHETVGMQNNTDVVYHSKIQDWKRALATPSDVTPYGHVFWDLHDGPVVVEIPPTAADGTALFGTLMDTWHRALEDIGVATGYDQGAGAKYLMLPPGYQGYVPESGYKVIRQKTYYGWALLRAFIEDKSEESLKKAAAHFKRVKMYPFSERANPKPNNYIDLADKDIDGIVKYTPDYFAKLHDLMSNEHIEEKDMAMMGMLAAMDIRIGEEYQTTQRRDAIFSDALKDAHEFMINNFKSQILPAFYADKKWTPLAPPGIPVHNFDFDYPSYLDYDRRGALYYDVFSSVKRYGPGNFFLEVAKDSSGQWFDGANDYKLHIDKDVPVSNFWNLTAYDMETAAFIRNMPKAGTGSKVEGLIYNDDGSVDLYIGPKAPKGKEANWIPTDPERKFFLLFRFYGAKPQIFSKQWQLNDLELMK